MENLLFDSAFFGWSNLPESIEIEGNKLIPIKRLKLKYKSLNVPKIRSICKVVGISVHRPVKGLYCIKEEDSNFFNYLDHLLTVTTKFFYLKDFITLYDQFVV